MSPERAPARTALLVGLALAAFAAFILAFCQTFAGFPFREVIRIDPEDSFAKEGIGFRTRFPKELRNPVAEAKTIILEDGRPLGPRLYFNQPVKDHGGGRFNILDSRVWYSTSDNSDPRTNGRTYEFLAPVPLAPGWAVAAYAGFLGCLVALARIPGVTAPASRWRAKLSFVSSAGLAVAMAAAAVAVGVVLLRSGTINDGFAVKDMPYSDAQGWNELAIDLAHGRGLRGAFGAQRPLHPALLGALYMVVTPSVAVAQAFNVGVWALMVFFGVVLAGQAASRSLAFGIGALLLLSPFHRDMLHLILTEELGTMLGVASLYVFWLALCLSRRSGEASPPPAESRVALLLFLSGMLFGFSNLARPLTLLAAPLLGAVVLLDAAVRRHQWVRRTVVRGIALTAGVSIVILPWVVRQHEVHGIWSISSTSADLLYAGAKGEPWSVGLFKELEEAGVDGSIKGKVEFFMARYRATVAEDPGAYLRLVGRNVLDFFNALPLGAPDVVFLGIGFAFVAAIGTWLRFGSVAGVAAFIVTWPVVQLTAGSAAVPAAAVLGAGFALGLWRGRAHERILLLAIAATLAGNALLSAMIGNFGLNRMAGLRDLLAAIVLFNGIRHLTVLIGQMVARVAGTRWLSPEEGGEIRAGLPLHAAVAVAIAVTASVAATSARNLGSRPRGPDAPADLAAPSLPDELRWQAIAWLRAHLPEALDADGFPKDPVEIDLVSIGEYRTDLAANEDVGHWARPFAPRPYDRTIAYGRRGGSHAESRGLVAVIFPSPLPRGLPSDRFVVVAARNLDPQAHLGHDVLMLEALALLPVGAGDDPPRADPGAVIAFPPSPEARAILGMPDNPTNPQ